MTRSAFGRKTNRKLGRADGAIVASFGRHFVYRWRRDIRTRQKTPLYARGFSSVRPIGQYVTIHLRFVLYSISKALATIS